MDLKQVRLIKGVTQLQVTRDTGIAQSRISNAEFGVKILNVDERRRLDKYFSPIPIDWQQDVDDDQLSNKEMEIVKSVVNVLIHKGHGDTARFVTSLRKGRDIYKASLNIMKYIDIDTEGAKEHAQT